MKHIHGTPPLSAPHPQQSVIAQAFGKPGHYVQIAEKGAFAKSLRPRSAGERPIMLAGTFSDVDLLTLVDYVRSSRSVLPQYSMCGDDPIWIIARKGRGPVSVTFSDDDVGGCTAMIRQKGTQWEVTGCGCWAS